MASESLTKVQQLSKKLLAAGDVQLVLGFAEHELDGTAVPLFARNEDDVSRMKWDSSCSPILAKYLLEVDGPTALVAKPCDVRAVVLYLTENQLRRDDVFLIGMECPRMKDEHGRILPACAECTAVTPPLYDELVPTEADANAEEHALERMSSADRAARLNEELRKCILCFSCRQACVGCYCPTCFIDRNSPDWHSSEPDMGSKWLFHMGRTQHLTGRCVECGACERVCPSGVDIRFLIQEVTDAVADLYDYRTGMDPEQTPALVSYRPDDREVGFLGGEADDACSCNGR